jgi:hypothetical protein
MNATKTMPCITRRHIALMLAGLLTSLSACSNSRARLFTDERSRTPFVVESLLYGPASPKSGLKAITDSGIEIFGKAELNNRGVSLSSFGGSIPFPKWVQVTWRKPIINKRISSTGATYETLDFGDIVGNYRVEVLSRIPEELFTQASAAPGRTIKLHFLMKDDGVLLAWSIQEMKPGYAIQELFYGGDFRRPNGDGKVLSVGWYRTPDGKIVEDPLWKNAR